MFTAWYRTVTVQKITILLLGLFLTCIGLLPGTQSRAAGQMVIDSFDGPITQNEINSFKAYIQTLQPVVWPNTGSMQSEYAQGKSGESIKAMGLMYEITGDTAILDRMIYFCDVLLSQRNDILAAPYGHRTVWTNTIAPVWPGNNTNPASADSANGDPVGHLAYCGRLILQTPSIWNTSVPTGDDYGHGATYSQRAATFVTEADYVVNQFLFPNLLDLSRGNKYYFSTQSPYMSGAIMPWNQQMMISYGLQNLAAAHAIIGDNASLVSKYDGIVQTNLNWFFSDNTAKKTYTDSAGNTAYNWGYNPTLLGGEDSNHASLDVAGYFRAYLSSRYGITASMMTPFANMYADVMMRGPKDFSGRVDGTDGTGHGAPTTYARSGNLFLADLRPDMYYALTNADLSNKTTTSMDTFSRFMWAKNQRYKEGYSVGFSPAPGPLTAAQTITLSTFTSGASIRYTTDGSTPTSTTGTLYTAPFMVSSTTTVKAVAYTGDNSSPVSMGKYTMTSSDLQVPTAPLNLTATAASSSQINLSWTASTDNVGVTSYDVYRGATLVGYSTTNSYSNMGLSASTAYSYTVKAKDAAGNVSAASNTSTATTMPDSGIIVSDMSYFINSGDATINMNLNGDALVSIQDKVGSLREIVDYVNNGASVTLKSGYLSKLPVGQYTYTFTFSSGKNAVLILNIQQENLALNKSYYASSKWNDTYAASYAFDAKLNTRWSSVKGQVKDQYLGVDFGSRVEFNKVVFKETSFPRVNSFVLQYSDDGKNFIDIPGTADTSIGAEKIIQFDPVTSQYVRLWIYSTKKESGVSKEPTINEFEVYNEIDMTPPDLTIPADITIEATGERTPLDLGKASSSEGVTITNDAPKDFPLGQTFVTWTATNTNGITSTAVQLITVVDTKPPVITGASTTQPNGSGWYNVDVTVHFAVYDSGSGLASVTPDFVVSSEGINQTVTGTATDKAGNQASAVVGNINIDKTKPETVAIASPSAPDGSSGWYVHPVTFLLTAADNLSGLAQTEYSLDSGTTWKLYTGAVMFTQDGRYMMSYRSTDNAGNQELPKTISFNVDATAPVIFVTSPITGSSYVDSGDLKPQFTTLDPLSGIDSSKSIIMLNDKPLQQGSTVSLYTLPLGSNTIKVSSNDTAGNAQNVTVTFSTYANLDSLKALVTRFAGMKWIDNAGNVNSLQSKLNQGDLGEFIREVKSQGGKHITNEASTYLLRDTHAILDSLTAAVNQFNNNKSIDKADVAKDLLEALNEGNLKDFANKVEEETGKHISPDAAKSLLQGLESLLKDKKDDKKNNDNKDNGDKKQEQEGKK